jgi:acyl dehydratase
MTLDAFLMTMLSSSFRMLERVFTSMSRFLHVAGLRYGFQDVRWHEPADGILLSHGM